VSLGGAVRRPGSGRPRGRTPTPTHHEAATSGEGGLGTHITGHCDSYWCVRSDSCRISRS
jgi:hypothetical protein